MLVKKQGNAGLTGLRKERHESISFWVYSWSCAAVPHGAALLWKWEQKGLVPGRDPNKKRDRRVR